LLKDNNLFKLKIIYFSMFRIATLLEKRKSGSLEVCIEKKGYELQKDAKSCMGNTNDEVCRGQIIFYDKRQPLKIMQDFAFRYRAARAMGEDSNGNYLFVKYEKHITIIPLAFVEYFSKRQEDSSSNLK
jgi:hypothetical protein